MAEAKTEAVVKVKKAPAAKPAKAAAPKATATKAAAPKTAAATKAKSAAEKPATKRTSKAPSLKNVTPEVRYLMICEAAYYKAEKCNFSPENEHQNWLDAEAEINKMLGM